MQKQTLRECCFSKAEKMFAFLKPWYLLQQVYEGFEWLFSVRHNIEVRQGTNYLVLSRKNGVCNNRKWNCLIEELFVNAMANRNGCLFLNKENTFTHEFLNWEMNAHRKGSDNTDVFFFYKNCWTREDLHLIASSTHFYLSLVRFVPGLDFLKAVEMPMSDIAKLWMLNPLLAEPFGTDCGSLSEMEILGGFSDGKCAFWLNSSRQEVELTLENLKLIASDIGVLFDESVIAQEV